MAWRTTKHGGKFEDANILGVSDTQTEIVATPGARFAIWVYGWRSSAPDAAGTFVLESATSDMAGPFGIAKNGGDSVGFPLKPYSEPIFKCHTNEALNITAAGTGANVQIFVKYRTVGV